MFKKIFYIIIKSVHPSWTFLSIVLGIIGGDILMLIWHIDFFGHIVWLFLGILLMLVVIIMSRTFCLPFAFLASIMMICYRGSFDLAGQDYLRHFVGQSVTMTGIIAEDPDTSESRTALRLTDLQIGDSEVAGAVYVSMAKNAALQRSDTVTLTGKFTDGFGTFSGSFYRPKIIAHARGSPGDVFLFIRNWFSDHITRHIPSPESALGLGYLLGVRSSLPTGLAEMLKVVGLTHIIVASGANLSILIGFARKFFGRLSRFAGLFCSVFLVIFYIGIVGVTPSMSRAGLVSLLSLIAWYVGRNFRPARLLLIVAAMTLFHNPMYIIDLGWLLSFASFAGIMLLAPMMTDFFYGNKPPSIIGATAIETMSASLVCMPILLYFFGTISLISIVANLLILPTTTVAMVLTFVTGIADLFFAPLAVLVGKIGTMLLSYHLWVINFFGTQEIFSMHIDANNPMVFLLYIPIVLAYRFLLHLQRKKASS